MLRGLREDATKARGIELYANFVSNFCVGVEVSPRGANKDLPGGIGDLVDHLAKFEDLDFAEFVVVTSFKFSIGTVTLVRRLDHRLFEGCDDLVRIDAFVFGDLIDLSF